MTAPARRRQADTTPAAVCRCPAPYPIYDYTSEAARDGAPARSHHPNMCGLPDEPAE